MSGDEGLNGRFLMIADEVGSRADRFDQPLD